MQKQDPWNLAGHVLVNRNDVDTCASQRFQHSLELGFEHCKIAIHHGFVVAAHEGSPGVDTHRIARGLPVHLCFSTNGHLVHAVCQFALPQDGLDLLRVQRALRWVDLRRWHLASSASRLLHVCENLPHGGGKLLFIAHASDVHEHHPRRVPEEMIVQRSDFEPIVQGRAHRGIHLVLAEHHVSHHHRSIAVALERCPARQTHGRSHLHARRGDG